ncbi:hypothetical protein FIA58_003570 [Flavobacterium jejuense]|uniref:Trimeric autotransporter adhesin YadA-like head domain-containing protein n=1 Tax=Flavobacterium jejuense TaxID=1544455 RepID=A0ABX0IRJ5_9FLAO|nr:hypothetical protein [Flavobacterium jejuense]NHN24746.1 hypothetical protein [Flavobacterium jejuense]
MKRTLLLTIACCFTSFLFSQVGIGTTTPSASSALEIKSKNSGLLIPRISLLSTTDTTTITSPATSLLIYNTATASDVTPGFYYWDTVWKKIGSSVASATGSISGWDLTGNTLSTGSEYLGTNNYYPLLFKVNNSNFGRFHPNGGLAIGSGATSNDNNSIAIGTSANASTSNEAVAIGRSSIASGFQSLALGLSSSATNNETVAIGKVSSATGFKSIALGVSATSSNNNTLALGNSAIASGQQATALGTEANASAQNATAIGYQATATQANSIILGSTTNTNNKVGIGTNTPDERLHVNGSVKIVDGTQANGKVLVSDSHGKASWSDLNELKLYGEIYRNSDTALISGQITLGTNGVVSGSTIVLGTNNIQVQKTGLYRVSYTISLKKNSGGTINPEFFLGIYGTEIPGTRTYATISNGDTRTVSFVKLVNLTAYQPVAIYSSLGDSNTNILANGCNLIVELIK